MVRTVLYGIQGELNYSDQRRMIRSTLQKYIRNISVSTLKPGEVGLATTTLIGTTVIALHHGMDCESGMYLFEDKTT